MQYLSGVKGGNICRRDVCAEWRTDLTLFNPWEQTTRVDLTFANPKQTIRKSIELAPGQQKELADAVNSLFRTSGLGLIGIVSDHDITARAFVYKPETTEGRLTQPVIEATNDVIGAGQSGELSRNIGDVDGAESTIVLANVGDGESDVDLVTTAGARTLSTTRHHLAANETIEIPLRQLTKREEHEVHVTAKNSAGAVLLSANTRSTVTGDGFHSAALAAPRGTRRRATGSGAMLNGHVVVDLYINVAQEDRAAIAQNRAVLEGYGYVIAGDASRVDFPHFDAVGYTARLGTNSATTGKDGRFSILVPPGGPTTGQIFHPTTPDALATFTVAALQGATAPISLPLEFGSICGMNNEGGVPNCHIPTATESATGYVVHEMGTPTYPPARRADECEILDGIVSSNTSPLLSYFGSTCNSRVIDGCCPNEGGWGIFSATICCLKNHKGRFCQEVTPFDMSIIGETSLSVDLAETDTFTLHNNACFGVTQYEWSTHDIKATLTGGGVASDHVEHYDATKLAAFVCGKSSNSSGWQIWVGDRVLTYQTPKCLDGTGNEEDEITFRDTGVFATFDAKLKKDLLYRFLGTKTMFSLNSSIKDGWHIAQQDTGCPGQHVHGNNPCSGQPDPAPHNCGWGLVEKVQ